MTLNWDSQPGQCGFDVYTSTVPYFDPDSQVPAATLPAWQTDYTAAAGVGDPTTNVFYMVRGRNCSTVNVADSNRAGEFDFNLVPGS